MDTTTKKPTITTASGSVLTIAPETANPLPVDEWFKRLAEWREKNKELVARISVEEFLADKHAENEKEFL